jgi:density-regulated protein DRP1
LKKAAKFFANKFATGSSVSRNPQGEDEIFIQGDVADEVEDMILDDEDKKAIAVFGGKVAGSQIEVVDEGKLKKKNA